MGKPKIKNSGNRVMKWIPPRHYIPEKKQSQSQEKGCR